MSAGSSWHLKMTAILAWFEVLACRLCLVSYWIRWVAFGWKYATKKGYRLLLYCTFALLRTNPSFWATLNRLPDLHRGLCHLFHRWTRHRGSLRCLDIALRCHPSASEKYPNSFWVQRGHEEIGTYRGAYWTLSAVMLARSGAFRKMPCFRPPLRIWLLLSIRCDLFESRRFVVLLYDRFVEILQIETNPQLTVGFFWIRQRADPWCRFRLFRDYAMADHLVQLFSISTLCLIGTLRLPCCTGGTRGSVLMSYLPDMSPIWSKELGNRVCRSLVLLIECHLTPRIWVEPACF